MQTLLLIIHIFVSILLVLVVLLQSGKGGGMGATFGGASQQIFGGRGAGSFLTRITTGAAIVFFVTSLSLSMLGSQDQSVLGNELDRKEKATTEEVDDTADAMGAQDAEKAEAADGEAPGSDEPAAVDAPTDAGVDAPTEAAVDAPTDAAVDAPADAAADAPPANTP